jgi:ApbE superfamily uncharacterized protein (UPF0280 family)
MSRDALEAKYAETLAELAEAKADALAALGKQLSEAHAAYLSAVDAVGAGEPDLAAVAAHQAARDHFMAVRWKLTVQREAAGLADHSWVDRTHPLAARDRRPDEKTEAERRAIQYRMSR